MRARVTAWVLTGVLGLAGIVLAAAALVSVGAPHAGTAPPGTTVTVAPPSAGPAVSGAPRAHLPLRKVGRSWVVPDAKPKKLTSAIADRYVGRLRDDTVRLLRRAYPGLKPHPGAPTTPSDDSMCDPDQSASADTVSAPVPRARADALPWAMWDSWRAISSVEPEFGSGLGGHDAHITLDSRGAPSGTGDNYQVRVTQTAGQVIVTATGPCL
ncbi:MAG TPA: hypothetical protein VGL93_30860 [Streptosporangiaceae bacterium]|jgi:hypothetical protein